MCKDKLCNTILHKINKEDKTKILDCINEIDLSKISLRLKFKIARFKRKNLKLFIK